SESEGLFTLDNGVVTAQIAKASGNLMSLRYKNLEMLDSQRQQGGYWEHNVARGRISSRVTIDPQTNHGERAEISIKGVADGGQMGSGPGGSVIADIEIRYALGRGDSGIYTYSIFSHPTNYPATSVGESRFCLKLNDSIFDWMTVDANRNLQMISTHDWNHGTQMNMKEARRMNTGIYRGQVEHKYDYSANQFDVRAWGWSSTTKHIGLWLINPSVEYLSGGPTKFELSSHRDATFYTNALIAPAPPTLLNYWRSSHYGGSICNIAATDAWTKVVGPFLIYCNSRTGATPAVQNELWRDALAQADKEAKQWPFDWVNGVDYPHQKERATVTGKIVLNDPQAPGLHLKHLLVGLTAPDYAPAVIPPTPRSGGRSGFGLAGGGDDEAAMTNSAAGAPSSSSARWLPPQERSTSRPQSSGTATNFFGRIGTNGFRGRGFGLPRVVDWQIDAKNYQFWVQADASGKFTIPNVRPGNYSLHAIADGVLGELTMTNVTVTAGQKLALGHLDWQPVRYGKQLWDIGIPNRTGAEFFKGDDYFHWGWYLQYPKLFPYDVKYVIGQSDFRKDWLFEQVPYNEDTNNVTGSGRGSATAWTVTFNQPEPVHGKATLRLAICGVGARTLLAELNDHSIGSVTNLAYNAVISRDGIGGTWSEHDLVFDAALMKPGKNVLSLTVPAGPLTAGIVYDYIRLELDENAAAPK
ncbi:MAG TPA: polysaccharide lyase family protein, partial [Verrucomicrobiae bacterium]